MAGSDLRRVLGVLVAPSGTFRALRDRPTWLVAFVLVIVVTGVVGQVAQARVDPEAMIRDMMRGRASAVSEERVEELLQRQKDQDPIVEAVVSTAFLAIIPVLCAGYFWMGSRLFGAEPTFRQTFSSVIHALVPWWALKGLLSWPVLLARSELTVAEASRGVLPSNLAFFLGEDAPALLRGLAASLDVFTLWGLFLLVLGISIVAGIPKAASGALTCFVWLLVLGLTLLPLLLPALIPG